MLNKGEEMWKLANRIFPICRSITGDGVRKTLEVVKGYIPEVKLFEVPTGTLVFDWIVPKEWNIEGGGIWYEDGTEIINFENNNLHIMGYSTPVDKWVDLEELESFIFTQPEQPELIPYVTSYYKERFGFCMNQKQKDSLRTGRYHIVIKSELKEGSLTYGEVIISGKSKEEIFFSTYICHPSMANNECSGVALSVYLIKWLKELKELKYTYRFIFIPETIGAITYLSKNLDYLKKNVKAGFNLSCVGDNDAYSIVESRYGNTLADKVLLNVLNCMVKKFDRYSFLKRGSDERQYNAPGVDLPVVTFCRSKYGTYEEYHTSADNMDFVCPQGFEGSYEIITQCIMALEYNNNYKVVITCEPQLGKRGLYPTISKKGSYNDVQPMLDFIAYCDGKNDLVDISNIINVSCKELIPIVDILIKERIITE